VTRPCTNRQRTSCWRLVDVAASAVAIAIANADPTITRRKPRRSASRPMPGAARATATVGAVMVKLTSKLEAWKVRARSGNSGCVAYRSTKAAKPASITGTVGTRLP
jgi:hypothetical protein